MERLFQVVMKVSISLISNAQISFSEACFYLKAGQDVKSAEKIADILYKGDKLYVANTHIYWVESNGTMGEKQDFIRIEKEALLPKNINRDFLYE